MTPTPSSRLSGFFILSCLVVFSSTSVAVERSPSVRAEFQRLTPCPNLEWRIRPGTAGGRRGACPGFEADHARPLCAGGDDSVANLRWLSVEEHRMKTKDDVRECAALRRGKRSSP